jgi:DnaJ-domain-containing protein 1
VGIGGGVAVPRNAQGRWPRARNACFWLAIAVTFVLLEVACFYGFSLLALNITYFAWISANIGGMVFGPVIWREHHQYRRRGATFRKRQAEKEYRRPLREVRTFSERQAEEEGDEERRRLEELLWEAQRQEAERQRRAGRHGAVARRPQKEERDAERQFQRERQQVTAQSQPEWWELLEVAPGESKEEIARKYRRKVQQCHPDRVAGLAPEFLLLAEERTKALNVAYEQAMRTSR